MFHRLAAARRHGSQRSLRLRVLVLTLAVFVAVAIPAAVGFNWIVDTMIVRLGTLFAERQILYDRHRGLEALNREVALAETLARSPVVAEWAADELDPAKSARGLAELEHFREAFADNSYFFVVHSSRNYYFNDADGSYTGDQRRYTLDGENRDDSWYFQTVALGEGCHLNVNHDRALSVTKVWINCVIENDGAVLGVLGTGIDLTMFIQNVVESDQRGVESMFVDRYGAVQANRNESLIDFHSLTKTASEKKTFFQLLDGPVHEDRFSQMISEVTDEGVNATARFLDVGGKRLLVGVGYLERLGWYNVTLMDIDQIIDRRLFWPLAALLAIMMFAAAALVTLMFKRTVLDRLAGAERALLHIKAGNFDAPAREGAEDEIGRLLRALNGMSRAVGDERGRLEAAVRERTGQLERIAYLDPLTGVLNRRGLMEAFEQKQAAMRRGGDGEKRLGLLILDVDSFKAINDGQGHLAGDAVIAEVARRLIEATRDNDICARWGGDEFVIILDDCGPDCLTETGERILRLLRADPVHLASGGKVDITTSVGAVLVEAGDTLERASARVDAALYRAKQKGRDRLVVFDPARHGVAGLARVA